MDGIEKDQPRINKPLVDQLGGTIYKGNYFLFWEAPFSFKLGLYSSGVHISLVTDITKFCKLLESLEVLCGYSVPIIPIVRF